MKTTSMTFGILTTLIFNSAFATTLTKPVLDIESDTIVVRNAIYQKTIEEVIKEDNLITEVTDLESDTIATWTDSSEKTMKKVIKEDNLIIENNLTNEIFPLDFDFINESALKVSQEKRQNSFSQKTYLKS